MKAAWTKAYKILSNMLIGRERHIYKEFDRYKWNTWRKFRINRKVAEVDDLYSFYLVPEDGLQLPSFMPGQYISIRQFVSEVGYYQTRQYSLSDSPSGDYYRITVKRDRGKTCDHNPGMVSNILIDNIAIGDEIDCSHPSGDFFLDMTTPNASPLVLISVGRGVAPLLSMLNAATKAEATRHIRWIHGCREEVPFSSQLTFLKRRCPNLHTTVFMTSKSKLSTWKGVTYDFNCRVDLLKVTPELLYLANSTTEYYICGPEDFMKTTVKQLADLGVDGQRIKCQLFTVGEMQLNSVCGYIRS